MTSDLILHCKEWRLVRWSLLLWERTFLQSKVVFSIHDFISVSYTNYLSNQKCFCFGISDLSQVKAQQRFLAGNFSEQCRSQEDNKNKTDSSSTKRNLQRNLNPKRNPDFSANDWCGVWKILPFWLAFTIWFRWVWVWCLNWLLSFRTEKEKRSAVCKWTDIHVFSEEKFKKLTTSAEVTFCRQVAPEKNWNKRMMQEHKKHFQ